MPADCGAASPQFLHSIFELLGRQIWKLQRHRADRNIAVRMSRTPFRELFILKPDDLGGDVAVRPIEPEAVDAQHLHVDSQLINRADAVRTHEVWPTRSRAGIRSQGRVLHDTPNLG